MLYSDTLKDYFPEVVTNSKINAEIINAAGTEFDNYYDKLVDLKLQFSISTATWALDIYEKELNITTDYTKTYDERRSVIESKWRRNTGKLTTTMIKIVCSAYDNGDVEVTYDGSIHIKFVSELGLPANINDLKAAVNEIKPAYKLCDYIFTYLTWNDYENYNKTCAEWDALNLTCDEFEIYKEA